jgi:hypothetical protein
MEISSPRIFEFAKNRISTTPKHHQGHPKSTQCAIIRLRKAVAKKESAEYRFQDLESRSVEVS